MAKCVKKMGIIAYINQLCFILEQPKKKKNINNEKILLLE